VPITFTVAAEDWPRFRFAHSALFETLQAVRTLNHLPQQQFHERWLRSLDHDRLRRSLPCLLALLSGSGPVWVPDFLAPPPTSPGVHAIEAELATVAAYPSRLVRMDLQHSLDSQPNPQRRSVLEPLIARPARARARLVRELGTAWALLAEPYWPAITRLVGDDIAYRARQSGRYGLAAVLDGLHENVRAGATAITVANSERYTIPLAGRGLLLMPSAFLAGQVLAVHEPPWPPTLCYPARGIGNLWAVPEPAPRALADLLGASRAELLLDLAEPRATTELTLRHGLSAATTSAHLGRLRAAGLLSAERAGRRVLYRRTRIGNDLVAAADPAPASELEDHPRRNLPG
jgi:DNA-binding transcriptional ArsR family regulator